MKFGSTFQMGLIVGGTLQTASPHLRKLVHAVDILANYQLMTFR